MRAYATLILMLASGCLTETKPTKRCELSFECPDNRPWCDPELGGCVACTESSQCAFRQETPLCNADDGTCVECMGDVDCTDASAARCNDNNQCAACNDDEQCVGVEGKDTCIDGECVQGCTVDNEATVCGDNSCDPATGNCTDTERGSVNVCRSCVADSECGDGDGNESDDYRCIELSFDGTNQGGKCLKLVDAGGPPPCNRPLTTSVTATSLSGAAEANYCGIREDLTTCEAVLAGASGATCDDAQECADAGALCETIGLGGMLCTYPCEFDTECPEGKPACLGGFCTVPPI